MTQAAPDAQRTTRGSVEAPPVVAIPGTLCTDRAFQEVEALLGPGVDVAHVSLSGHAHTEAFARRVLDQGPERFVICGFSQGSIVALEVIRRAPERVVGAVLLACNPGSPTDAQKSTWSSWKDQVRTEGRAAIERIGEALAKNVDPEHANDASLRDTIVAMARDTGVEDFLGQLEALASRPNAWGVVERMPCPALFMVGENDTVTPPQLHREAVARAEDAELRVIPGSGHYLPLEQPKAVAQHMAAWLEATVESSEARRA